MRHWWMLRERHGKEGRRAWGMEMRTAEKRQGTSDMDGGSMGCTGGGGDRAKERGETRRDASNIGGGLARDTGREGKRREESRRERNRRWEMGEQRRRNASGIDAGLMGAWDCGQENRGEEKRRERKSVEETGRDGPDIGEGFMGAREGKARERSRRERERRDAFGTDGGFVRGM